MSERDQNQQYDTRKQGTLDAAALTTRSTSIIAYIAVIAHRSRKSILALRNRPDCKWLNLETLLDNLLPDNSIVAINYYYAPVSGKFGSTAPDRQRAYVRALRTLKRMQFFPGKFYASKQWAKVIPSKSGQTILPPVIEAANNFYESIGSEMPDEMRAFLNSYAPEAASIIRQEEKGSDVTLSVHLVRDAFLKKFDTAVVLTNDTDMTEAIRIVVQEAKIPVGIICPDTRVAKSLAQHASFVRHLEPTKLRAAQFPNSIQDGRIVRPKEWQEA